MFIPADENLKGGNKFSILQMTVPAVFVLMNSRAISESKSIIKREINAISLLSATLIPLVDLVEVRVTL